MLERENIENISLVDSPEDIRLCLNCGKRECNNCLSSKEGPKKVQKLSLEHERFMELYNSDMTDSQIAAVFKVDRHAIIRYRKKHNLPALSRISKFNKEKFMELYEQGCTDEEIADELGLMTSYVTAKRQQLKLPSKNKPGRRRKNAKRF
jgi:predicted transcriptional regulator